MIDPRQAVSDLPPDGAAYVDYPEYRKKHPLPPDDREIARQAAGARIFILPPEGAANVNYSMYDRFQLEPSEPQLDTNSAINGAAPVGGPRLCEKEL